MISQKQLEANRRNAQRSTGPRTDEGKERSSRNNLRHGLTGQISVLPSEDREAHDRFVNALIDSLKPETPMEQQLAQSIAEDSWRLNRVCALETNIFALGREDRRNEIQIALADARTFLDHASKFQLLSVYEQRINRNLQRNLQQLRGLQAERKQERERALEEAKLLAQFNLVNGLPFEPEENGFVFSAAEINRAIDRDNRLREAREASQSAKGAVPPPVLRVPLNSAREPGPKAAHASLAA
jgi:hypothetical protein